MTKNPALFLLLLSFFSNIALSQTKDSVKVYIYEPFKSGQSIDVKKDIKVDHNCLKWNWSLLGRGVLAFNYERLISSKLSFELGAGLTYMDFLYEAVHDGDGMNGDSKSYDVTLGPYIEGNLRFYPVEGDLEGFYLSPFIRYRGYNLSTTFDDSGLPANSGKNSYNSGYNMTDIGFNIGIQRETWITGVMVESYFGVAYRYRVVNNPYVDYVNSNPVVIQEKTSKWIPALTIGFKIGIPF